MLFEHGLFGLLLRTAIGKPQAPAVALGTRTTQTYAGLLARSARLSGGLQKLGCRPGDRVAVFMKNDPAWLEILFGCWHAGLAVVPVNVKLHARELAFILRDCEAKVMFHDENHAEALQALASLDGPEGGAPTRGIAVNTTGYAALMDAQAPVATPVDPQSLAWLFYTSGTTGQPKGAMLTHANLLSMAMAYANDVEPEGVSKALVHAAPMSHGSGLYILPHVLHGSVQVCPESRGFDALEVEELASHYPSIAMFAAPTMVSRMTNTCRGDLPGLNTLVYGGGPMYVADCVKAMDRFGNRLAQIYGQGETPMTITSLTKTLHDRAHPDFLARLASCGLPQTGVRVRILDEEGAALPVGETGEIVVRAPTVMQSYWRLPEATARALKDGWLYTGDVGAFDANGFLTLKDRSKDVIISGGSNIYPREVEEVLLRHPGLLEVSVLGQPDADWGETVVAFYSCRAGHQPRDSELDQLCIDHIARFKRPKVYLRVDELPKNAAGKILKNELKKRLDA
ncbi:MAG: long-chain fatty acid--CoA ligase [Comamonadaceae bacterium]|nr:MAG: long-chain fatty acid--CoA ligase [Comamonadaceae bacterium]